MIVGRHQVERSTPVHAIKKRDTDAFLTRLPEQHGTFARLSGFDGSAGQVVPLPDGTGRLAMVLLGVGEAPDPFATAALNRFPEGSFALGEGFSDPTAAALGFLLGLYKFDSYSTGRRRAVKLVAPDAID
ncbi:MAG: leucyl aminopeptidase family protein, partial [Pseudomonadota bacterium]